MPALLERSRGVSDQRDRVTWVVGHAQSRQSSLLDQALPKHQGFAFEQDVEARERLIEENCRRVEHQVAGDGTRWRWRASDGEDEYWQVTTRR